MKDIVLYLQEGFKLNKKSLNNIKKELTDDEIDDLLKKYTRDDVPQKLKMDIHYKTPQAEWTNSEKMKAYHDKGSKPERLVATIKNQEKMIKRWVAAMDMEWEEAADVFKQAIIDRGYYTKDELEAFIIVYKVKLNRDKYAKYL